MYKIDFNNPIHAHFIGIGGISMSGLARILLMENFTVSGSDLTQSPITQELCDLGAKVFYGHKAENIASEVDCVIYTAAISSDNDELKEVLRRQIPTLTRAEFLGQIMLNYKMPIAVSGTHGKTTTTSMLSTILLKGEMDPTISVGGILPIIKGNIKVGNSDIFITEACEYANSFLDFNPEISIILNIEEDHLDFFDGLDSIMDTFKKFAKKLPPQGTLIINGDIKNYQHITNELDCNIITFGFSKDLDYSASNITYNDQGLVSFDCIKNGTLLDNISLSVTGEHNAFNALASIAAANLLGLSLDTIKAGLEDFKGAERRFEYKGSLNGVHIIDDYAHHPTEVKVTLNAIKHYPHRELWCVFQPHTYTRTKALFDDFVEVLSSVDHLILTDIYAAREKNTIGICSKDLEAKIAKKGTDVKHFETFLEIENYLKENCLPGDLLITMGAGNVVNIGENLLK